MLSPRSHQFVRFCRVFSVEEPRHLRAEVLKVDGFCDITVKAGGYALFDNLRHDICGERNDGHKRGLVGPLPCADITAGLIAVLSWHMKVTLVANVRRTENSMPRDLQESVNNAREVLKKPYMYTQLHQEQPQR
jgi:hypothetical protein